MASNEEVQQVLANWISRASEGGLPEGVEVSQWVATNFLGWLRKEAESDIGDAEVALSAARAELNRLGGWENSQLSEALHELIHAGDAIASLRSTLGLASDPPTQDG
jgi:hypothetical protein